jgi:hypothetical protein
MPHSHRLSLGISAVRPSHAIDRPIMLCTIEYVCFSPFLPIMSALVLIPHQLPYFRCNHFKHMTNKIDTIIDHGGREWIGEERNELKFKRSQNKFSDFFFLTWRLHGINHRPTAPINCYRWCVLTTSGGPQSADASATGCPGAPVKPALQHEPDPGLTCQSGGSRELTERPRKPSTASSTTSTSPASRFPHLRRPPTRW